jgi:hypothetical protein
MAIAALRAKTRVEQASTSMIKQEKLPVTLRFYDKVSERAMKHNGTESWEAIEYAERFGERKTILLAFAWLGPKKIICAISEKFLWGLHFVG